jgi:endogenous inhibitor of DNA gyrase (YacG/DUF329 family)
MTTILWPRSCESLASSVFQSTIRLLPSTIRICMPRNRAVKLRCPICKKAVKSTDAEFPFCGDRCRTIDLGKWASGAYVIKSPVSDVTDALSESGPSDLEAEVDEDS